MKAKNKKHWINYITNRDDSTCQRCGLVEIGQTPHHIKPKGRYPGLALETDNGVYLCFKCHRWTHDNPKEAHKEGLFYVRKYDN